MVTSSLALFRSVDVFQSSGQIQIQKKWRKSCIQRKGIKAKRSFPAVSGSRLKKTIEEKIQKKGSKVSLGKQESEVELKEEDHLQE